MVKAEGHRDKDSEPAPALVWVHILTKPLRSRVASFPRSQFLHL